MLLLRIEPLLMRGCYNLIVGLGTSYWHCLDSLSGSIRALAVERGLIEHHLTVAVLIMRHAGRESRERARISRTVHVFVDTH